MATNRHLSRRDFLKLGGAGMAGAALLGSAGCGNGGQEGGVANLVFSFGPDDSGTLQELIDRFNREFRGEIQVEWRVTSRDTGEYFRSVVGDFRAGGGDIDVIGGDVIWAAELAANGWIEDLSRRMYTDFPVRVPDAFLREPLNTCSYQNKFYGVPWFSDAGMLFYRRDLLEDAGLGQPPATWTGLREMADQVKQGSGTRYGLVFQGDDYEGGVANGCEFIWNAGGRILTGNVTVQSSGTPFTLTPNIIEIDNPDSAQGLRTERAMITEGTAPRQVTGFQEEDCWRAFLAGDAVFMRGWPFMYALAADEELSNIDQDQIGISTIPVEQQGNTTYSCLGGWNMYVNSASGNQDAAWEFIKWMTAPEQQRFRALEGSFLPTLSELYEDREILDNVAVISQGREAIESTRSRPVTPFYSVISQRLAVGFNRSLSGEVAPEETVADLQRELETVVAQS